MAIPAPTTPRVEMLWRPGCGFCSSLRRGLKRAGVAPEEHDIWSSPEAAARVRAATGGDETVPTIIVGRRSLVNPSVSQVLSAISAEFPDLQQPVSPTKPGTPRGPGEPGRLPGLRTPLSTGLLWTVTVAVVWIALTSWRPTTTWHLAPLFLAAAWPWVVGQDLAPGDTSARRRVALAGGAGLLAASSTALLLAAAGRLLGPTFTGSGSTLVESLALGAAGALLATVVGLTRTIRRTSSATASTWSTQIATSDEVIAVEGNAYFPRDAVLDGVLQASRTRTVCPWKGVASYYDVHAGDDVIKDGAWTYPHPLPLARRIRGRVAFWNGVEVTLIESDPDRRHERIWER